MHVINFVLVLTNARAIISYSILRRRKNEEPIKRSGRDLIAGIDFNSPACLRRSMPIVGLASDRPQPTSVCLTLDALLILLRRVTSWQWRGLAAGWRGGWWRRLPGPDLGRLGPIWVWAG
jgi:hypothetical protein